MAKKTLSDCMIEILSPIADDTGERYNAHQQENPNYNKAIKILLEIGFLSQMLKTGSFTGLLPNSLEYFAEAEKTRQELQDKYRDDLRENYIPQEVERAIKNYKKAEARKDAMQLLESELQRVYEYFLHTEYQYTPYVAKKEKTVNYEEVKAFLSKAS